MPTTRKPTTRTRKTTTTTRKKATTSTPRKTSATTKRATTAAAKAPAAAAPTPAVTNGMEPVVSGPAFKRKELVDTVTQRSGVKKQDVNAVVNAMLDVMGEAVAASRDLHLHPFGVVMLKRIKEMPNGSVIASKIRRKAPEVPDAPETPETAEATD